MLLLPKPQHPSLHTHAPKGKLMNHTLHRYLMLGPVYITGPKLPSCTPGPHFLSAYELLYLAVWNTSQTQHVGTKYTRWWKGNWTPSKTYSTTWLLPVASHPELSAPPPPLGLEEMKAALGLPFALAATASESATHGLCPRTQEEHAENWFVSLQKSAWQYLHKLIFITHSSRASLLLVIY